VHLNAVLGLSIFRCGLLPGIQKSSKTKLCQNRAKKKKKKRKKADAHIKMSTHSDPLKGLQWLLNLRSLMLPKIVQNVALNREYFTKMQSQMNGIDFF